jgi:hypothetical protein
MYTGPSVYEDNTFLFSGIKNLFRTVPVDLYGVN